MARNDMAAELVADLERTFEIDLPPGLPVAGGGQAQRLFPRFDLEPAGIGGVFRQGDDSQAYAGAGNRGADIDRLGIVDGVDAQADALVERNGGRNGPHIGDDTGKHQISLIHSAKVSSPKRASRTRPNPVGIWSRPMGAAMPSVPMASGP